MLLVFGIKREEETRGLKKLHIDELHNTYSSPGSTLPLGTDRFNERHVPSDSQSKNRTRIPTKLTEVLGLTDSLHVRVVF
jgi:hypothetical protein